MRRKRFDVRFMNTKEVEHGMSNDVVALWRIGGYIDYYCRICDSYLGRDGVPSTGLLANRFKIKEHIGDCIARCGALLNAYRLSRIVGGRTAAGRVKSLDF